MKLIAAFCCTLMLAWTAPVWAALSRDDAAAMAEKASGGRVLAVEKTERDGKTYWRVKVVTPQGEVKVMLFDAAASRGH
jgi:uncharacterized membrane protein YkoI